MTAAFKKIKAELLPGLGLAAAIFNVGGGFVRKPFLELSEGEFLSGLEVNGYVWREFFFLGARPFLLDFMTV